LPNAPGLLYPGKNHDRLLKKRNRLLVSLHERKIIDGETLELAMAEPIPDKPLPLPDLTRHYFSAQKNNAGTRSTIHFRIQDQCLHITNNYARKYSDNQIQNIAVIVSDIHSGKIIAYVGNTDKKWSPSTSFVDCANAPRSTGSILKPLLYYKSLSNGLITPQSMLFDIPVSYNHFTPQNYARSFEGLVQARTALSKSLNIPMVTLLNEYGLPKFHNDLKQLGFKHFNRQASNYGLSLILGSGEVTLRELNEVYGKWAGSLYHKEVPLQEKACIYETLEAMSELNRPDENGNWKAFINTQKIAWKTGTSFGNRDAWCVGISSAYVVSVWVGNADGSGRTGLTGIEYAAPILFDIFNALPKSYQWFPKPKNGYTSIELCKASGYKAGDHCEEKLIAKLPSTCASVAVCPFHHMLTVNNEETYQVNASVCDWRNIKLRSYFILPPSVLAHYKSWNPDFKAPPPLHPGIKDAEHELKIIFPVKSKILLFGKKNQMNISFKALSPLKNGIIYWHIDEQFIGSTTNIHEMQYVLPPGQHTLMILDPAGNQQQSTFEIIPANP
jgi:penicillin-binding protein 1C